MEETFLIDWPWWKSGKNPSVRHQNIWHTDESLHYTYIEENKKWIWKTPDSTFCNDLLCLEDLKPKFIIFFLVKFKVCQWQSKKQEKFCNLSKQTKISMFCFDSTKNLMILLSFFPHCSHCYQRKRACLCSYFLNKICLFDGSSKWMLVQTEN